MGLPRTAVQPVLMTDWPLTQKSPGGCAGDLFWERTQGPTVGFHLRKQNLSQHTGELLRENEDTPSEVSAVNVGILYSLIGERC